MDGIVFDGLYGEVDSPVSPESVLDVGDLSRWTVDLVDGEGIPLAGQVISFFGVGELLRVGSYEIGLGRSPVSATTNSAGHAEGTLARGLKVRVVFTGTSLIREIEIPDTETFDLLALIGTASDPMTVRSSAPTPALRNS